MAEHIEAIEPSMIHLSQRSWLMSGLSPPSMPAFLQAASSSTSAGARRLAVALAERHARGAAVQDLAVRPQHAGDARQAARHLVRAEPRIERGEVGVAVQHRHDGRVGADRRRDRRRSPSRGRRPCRPGSRRRRARRRSPLVTTLTGSTASPLGSSPPARSRCTVSARFSRSRKVTSMPAWCRRAPQ